MMRTMKLTFAEKAVTKKGLKLRVRDQNKISRLTKQASREKE